MPKHIEGPTRIAAAGNLSKTIEEFVGRSNTGDTQLSIARMVSPEGWYEAGQRPEFAEFTIVLRGVLRVDHEDGALEVRGGEAVITQAGEWVRYSTPAPGGCEYLAVCTPAFSPDTVHRDG